MSALPVWAMRGVRLVTAAGMGVDAYVHIDLAPTYAEAGGTISEETLFRVEAAAALAIALAVVVSGRRIWLMLGFGVAASALLVMIVSRYADLAPLSPFPSLYDPVWYPEKLLAAFGEGAAALASLAGILLSWKSGRRTTSASSRAMNGRFRLRAPRH